MSPDIKDITMNEFKTPRFVLSAFFSLSTTFAWLFTEKMTTDQYTYVMLAVLGIYGVRAVLANRK